MLLLLFLTHPNIHSNILIYIQFYIVIYAHSQLSMYAHKYVSCLAASHLRLISVAYTPTPRFSNTFLAMIKR